MTEKAARYAVKRKPRVKKAPVPREESELEVLLAWQMRALQIPEPEKQLMFAKEIKRRWLFDFSWTALMLAVEVQGGQHRSKGAHNTSAAMNRDCEKECASTLLGWTLVHVTGDQVRSGEAVTWIEKIIKMKGGM